MKYLFTTVAQYISSASGIGYASKKISKMAGNSAS